MILKNHFLFLKSVNRSQNKFLGTVLKDFTVLRFVACELREKELTFKMGLGLQKCWFSTAPAGNG